MIEPNNIDFSKLQGLNEYTTTEQIESFPRKEFTVWDKIRLAIQKLLPPEGIKRGRIGFLQSNINLNGKPQFFENGSKVKTKDLFNIY